MASDGDNDMCWICLEEAAENGSHQLVAPCKCPRKVHPQCLARWQLQQAGRHEEKFCRFCNNELADWKRHLTPEELKPEVSKVQPIMVVYFEGQIHRIPVKQGPDGLDEFTGKIRELFRLPEDVDISLTFGCKEPMSGSHLKLEGMGAFDAAVHCASVAAAERQQKIKKSYSTGNLGSSPAQPGPEQAQRSASINNLPGAPPTNISAAAGSAASARLAPPTTPPPAAGSAAARSAAADRRQRFPGQQQQQQPAQQPPASGRSRSFSAFSSAGPRSNGAEPPAGFRNILGLLNSGAAAAPAGQQQQQQQQQQAGAAGGRGSPAPLLPQAPPRVRPGGLPPLSPSSHQGPTGGVTAATSPVAAAAAAAAGASATASAAPSLSQAQREALKRERLSLRNISELRDVPEADETVAVGSLSGKFKLNLKAFSRRVARSLSFTSKSGSSGGGAPGSEGGSDGSASDGSSSSSASSGSDAASAGSVVTSSSVISASSAVSLEALAGGRAIGSISDAAPASPSSLSSASLPFSSNPTAEAPLAAHPAPGGTGHSPLPPPTPAGVCSC